ncbi:type II toxin-antitoxin system VapB family antitoxin [Brucella tritici]|uniref:type II toxin-antitoxin system VapB family antitoxin n=1 Tax=Brucella tritici TaxID=94626 RepID=UPI003D6D4C74
MPLHIRNQEADRLARELARMDHTTVTNAVISALREAIRNRMLEESPQDTAQRILKKRGLSFQPNRKPVPPETYSDLDRDIGG